MILLFQDLKKEDPFVFAIKYAKVVQMTHFTRKVLPFRSKLLRGLAERIVRTPESKIFCTGMGRDVTLHMKVWGGDKMRQKPRNF